SRREAAERFEMRTSSALKWAQSWREERSAAPQPQVGSASPFATAILAFIAEQPNLTLVETVTERRIGTSRCSLWRLLDRHGVMLKKSLQAAERQRIDVPRARGGWMREQGMFNPAQLVFIDETTVSTNLIRLRAPRGVRVHRHVSL